MNDEIADTAKVSFPWTSVRYLATFEEANMLRESLKARDFSGTLQVKIKRCGVGGTTYVVKKRESAEIIATTQVVEDELATKPQKKTRKSKK